MTAIVTLVCVLALCFALGYLGRSLYGTLRLSELLGVAWILLAGPRERAQLQAILADRQRVAEAGLETWVRSCHGRR